MIDIIIFALIAFLIGRRLYKALGDTKHDNELSEESKRAYQELKESLLKEVEKRVNEPNQININSALEAELSEDERKILDEIRNHIVDFTADKFIRGAASAFEIILKAYTEQDMDTLKKLVESEMLERFLQDIEQLKAKSQKRNITVVGILNTKILTVERHGAQAMIKVKFESEQISNIVNSESGEVVSGSATHVVRCVDTWVFSKKITSKSNIWVLVGNEV
jgi:predicted lipid-binding transport protein (Tim44 family)